MTPSSKFSLSTGYATALPKRKTRTRRGQRGREIKSEREKRMRKENAVVTQREKVKCLKLEQHFEENKGM